MPSRYELTDHVAIVTGANHGIGAATATSLADCGAKVLISYLRVSDPADSAVPENYRRNRAGTADRTLESIEAAGGYAASLEADLGDPQTPERLFDFAESMFGSVDILINNATGWVADTFLESDRDGYGRQLIHVSAETHDRQFSVDARGGSLMISEFARRHLKRSASWGRIISLTSGGESGFPGEVSYGAAKAALESYTMSAAFELAPFGVTANIVHPPVTDTGWVTDTIRKQVMQSRDLFHIAAPEEAADVITYLCSNEARLISGNRLRLR